MRRNVRLKIFSYKTFGGKHLYREPKLGVKGMEHTHVCGGSSACGAYIGKVFECFKFLLHWAGVFASVALCTCAHRCACGAPIEPVLVFSEVPHRWFWTRARLKGPLRDPFFELVQFCRIIEGRPKLCSRTFIWKHNISKRIDFC